MRVKDTSFDIHKFIELIKERRPIYALNDKDHHNRLIVDCLWNEVSHEMQKSVIECKTKWHQLRNNYARELRREKVFSRKSIWHLRKPLNFLQNHIIQSRPTKKPNDKKIPGLEAYKNNLEKNSTKARNPDTIPTKREETYEEDVVYDEYGIFEELPQQIETYEQNSMDAPASSSPLSQDKSETLKIEKIDERENSRRDQEKNTDKTFFQSLFPDMQKLSSRRKRKFKEIVLVSLNRLLDEEEEEGQCSGYQVSYETVE